MEVGAETVSGSEKVFEEPRFDFDCSYSYGRFRAPIPPLNRHFVPRLAKLKVLKMVKDVRLPDRHLARIPHGAVETTTIGMTHTTLPMNYTKTATFMLGTWWRINLVLSKMESDAV